MAPLNDIVVIGTTNDPYEMSAATRRRFSIKIKFDLPDEKERFVLLTEMLGAESTQNVNSTVVLQDIDLKDIAVKTKGFSRADLNQLCSMAATISLNCLLDKKMHAVAWPQHRIITGSDFQEAFKLFSET